MRAPSERTINAVHTMGDKTMDLGWVYTVLAGVAEYPRHLRCPLRDRRWRAAAANKEDTEPKLETTPEPVPAKMNISRT